MTQRGWIPLATEYIKSQQWLTELFMSGDEEILSFVCQFNFLEYLYITADYEYRIDAAYPSFGVYKNYRTEPIIARLITDEELRKTVPELNERHLADFIHTVDLYVGRKLSLSPTWGMGAWSNNRIRNLIEYSI